MLKSILTDRKTRIPTTFDELLCMKKQECRKMKMEPLAWLNPASRSVSLVHLGFKNSTDYLHHGIDYVL